MRTRDEVLAEFQVSYHEHVGPQYSVEALADRIRELESQQAASEPVAWAIYDKDGDLVRLFNRHDHALQACWFNSDSIVPLYLAPPSAAGER